MSIPHFPGGQGIQEAVRQQLRSDPFTAERIAKIYRVPYWLVGGGKRPSWFRRPIWRLRAIVWRYL